MKKLRFIFLLAALSLVISLVASCSGAPEQEEDDGRLSVVATLFPQYDFAREVAGDNAEITQLLPPGMESHSWEPTPADIIKINRCDLFIYIGEDLESWAADIIESIDSDVRVLDISAVLDLSAFEEGGEEHEEHEGHGEHEHEPHFWCDPLLAKQMTNAISAVLGELDPDNAELYGERAAAYCERLDSLDAGLRDIAASSSNPVIYHGGRFAFYYLAEEYGFGSVAAYDSCSNETEPSAAAVAALIDAVRSGEAKAIFYEELSDPKVARAVSEETGAPMLLLHSCHNLTREELDSGENYLSLMERNIANLRTALVD